MKLYFLDINKNLMYAVKDKDVPYFTHSTNIPMTIKEVDETANQSLCLDLLQHTRRYDENGLTKYYLDADGDIATRDGWVEFTPPIL